jgi:hypothetical protein
MEEEYEIQEIDDFTAEPQDDNPEYTITEIEE